MPDDYSSLYQSAGNTFNVDPLLAQAVAQVESGGDPNAVSRDAQGNPVAHGVMQITTPNLQRLNVPSPYNPQFNIPAGTRMLDEALTSANGDVPQALRIYQGGPDQSKWGPQNAAYPAKVAAAYQKLAAVQPNSPARPNDAVDDLIAGKSSHPANDALDDFIMGKSTPAQTQAAPTHPAAANDPLDDVISGGNAPAWTKPKPTPPQGEPTIDPITGFPIGANGVPVPGAGSTLAGQDQGTLSPGSAPAAGNIVQAGVQGLREGFGDQPVGLSAQSQDALARAGIYNGPGEYNPLKAINRAVINPLAAAGDLAWRGGNALLGAYQRGVAQAGEEVGAPALGRDLAALPEAFPTGDTSGGTAIPHPTAGGPAANPLVREISPAAHDALDAPLPAAFRDNPLAATAPATPRPMVTLQAGGGQTLQVPAKSGGALPEAPSSANPHVAQNPLSATQADAVNPLNGAAPGPQSVGAAASSSAEANMTPAQIQAYRSTAEGQKLLESQPVGQADPHMYVPGVSPDAAEIEQSVNTSRELKALNTTAPEVSQEAKNIAAENNDARHQYFAKIAGSDVDVANAKAAREAQAEKDLTAAWANKQEADPQPVFDLADQLKTSPDGRRPLVRSVIDSVTNEMKDADGNPITDPEQLYGVRKHIDDLMSKEAAAGDPKNVRAMAQLQQLKSSLDGVIEPAAPGFQQYLDNFSSASRPIDTMQALQGHENKLYDAQNRMGYNKVQTMMRQIVDSRQAPGLNPYKSIPDETMEQLWNLRDDLRRSASAQELARTPGSDTAQNAWDIARQLGTQGAIHVGANLLSPGIGSLVVQAAHAAAKPIMSARRAQQATARGMELLHPKTPLRNPLISP